MHCPSESASCFLSPHPCFGGGMVGVFRLLLETCAAGRPRLCSHAGELRSGVILGAGSGIQHFQLRCFGRGTNFHRQALDLCPETGPGGRQQFWFREEGRVKLHLGSACPCTRSRLRPNPKTWSEGQSFARAVPGTYIPCWEPAPAGRPADWRGGWPLHPHRVQVDLFLGDILGCVPLWCVGALRLVLHVPLLPREGLCPSGFTTLCVWMSACQVDSCFHLFPRSCFLNQSVSLLTQQPQAPFAPLSGVGYGSQCLRDGERHSSCKMDAMSSKQGMLAEGALWLQGLLEMFKRRDMESMQTATIPGRVLDT